MSQSFQSIDSMDEFPVDLCARNLASMTIVDNEKNMIDKNVEPNVAAKSNSIGSLKSSKIIISNKVRNEVEVTEDKYPFKKLRFHLPEGSTDVKIKFTVGGRVYSVPIELSKSPKSKDQNLKDKPVIPVSLVKKSPPGSGVLWNFLLSLLEDTNQKSIIRWLSIKDLKFQIVNPVKLAKLWGQVKGNANMDWKIVKKTLEMYTKKKLLRYGNSHNEFIFCTSR